MYALLTSAYLAKRVAVMGAIASDLLYQAFIFTVIYCLFIVHNIFLYEKFLRNRRYLLYASLFIAVFGAHTLLFDLMDIILGRPRHTYDRGAMVVVYWTKLIFIFISFAVYKYFTYFRKSSEIEQMKLIRRDIELKQLQTQLNPHFLFNALNNIYSYSLNHNRKGVELLQKLNGLLHYIQSNSRRDYILLKEEIKFIEDYISFELEKLGARCNITFNKQIESPDIRIAPFILFTFVENAFKHGTNSLELAVIDINIYASDQNIHFSISNSLQKQEDNSTGIGLKNAEKRLALLYPEKHQLLQLENDDRYFVNLRINIV